MQRINFASINPVYLFYHFSVIFGLCPYIYDRKTQKVHTSIWLIVYGLILHGICISFIGPFYYFALKYGDFKYTFLKNTSQIIQTINTIIKALSIIFSIIYFHKYREDIRKVSDDILRLNYKAFKIEPGSKEEQTQIWFLKIVLMKILLTATLGFFQIGTFVQGFKEISWRIVGIFCCNCGMFLFQQYGVFYFYTAVGFVCKFYIILNGKLSNLYEDSLIYKGKGRISAEKFSQMSNELQKISEFYREIYEVYEFVKTVYEVQIVSTMISGLINNMTFWFAAYTVHYSKPFNLVAYLTMLLVTIGLYFDNYLMCAICGKSTLLWKEANFILGSFYTHKLSDPGFDRSVRILFCLYIIYNLSENNIFLD